MITTVFRYVYIVISLVLVSNVVCGQQVKDSIIAKIDPQYNSVGAVHRFFLGDSYRRLYDTPVRMPIINLGEEYGGFKVVKLGGGMQTQSLRLEDATGREWVLRSIQKYPERSLPESLRNTIAKDVVRDQVSIAHPFGALSVPPFNEALKIPHVSPRLVYVGDDTVLGVYRDTFKNRAYLLEPRMPYADVDSDNTMKVIRKVLEDNDKRVDQKLTLQSRLLDIVLGDWDRHEDNWRWNPLKSKSDVLYQPIPRDRDKVYYKTSGLLPVLLSYQWLKANVQPFGSKIRNIDQWNFNQRHFDRFFLNDLNLDDWMKGVEEFQKTIDDNLIHEALLKMPDTIYRISAPFLYPNIRIRRDSLASMVKTYYASLAKNVDIPLSEKNEFINLDYKEDGSILVEVNNKKKDSSVGRKLYKRLFYPKETDEIRVYGIAGQDEYTLSGLGKSNIKVRLIGGKEYDVYKSDKDFVNGRRLYIYDQKSLDSNLFELGKSVRYRLSNDTAVNNYDYYQFAYDRKGILADFDYGPDRGFVLGVGYLIQNQGFRKYPYAYSHKIVGKYSTGRQSFAFDYDGIYKQIWGEKDLLIDISSLGPRNQANFFGYGNNTVFIKEDDEVNDIDYGISYYRNRYDLASANFYLKGQMSKAVKYYFGSSTDFYFSRKDHNEDHFLYSFSQTNPNESVFGEKYFTGVTLGLDYDTRNRLDLPQSGIFINVDLGWRNELGGQHRTYFKSSNSISAYKSLVNDRLTIANRVGIDAVWGNPYFFQHVQLGGENSLRGFNSRRFTGKTGIYNNFDLRFKVFESFSYVFPASVGLIGFYDIGRVWMTNEKSNVWHNGIGGGVFIMPADLFVIQGTVGVSKEAVLPYIRIGLSF